MPEFRKDPIVGRWVIISVERGKRPSDYASVSHKRKIAGFCPFCPGNEYTTPKEVFAIRDSGEPNSSGWSLRVVPNKFPALKMDVEVCNPTGGLFDKMNGFGVHEVVIETPDHLGSISTIARKSVENILLA